MLTKKTLFILGAGASMPYGLPSGASLRDLLCLAHSSTIQRALKIDFKIPRQQIEEFASAFLKSRQPSIDTFLAKRPDLVGIGKLCIAIHLCQSEDPDGLFRVGIEDDWYLALWRALQDDTHTAAEIASNRIRFVTFNYDRSLECFLHEAMKNSHGITEEEAGAICQKINIQHVYGQLGDYQWNKDIPGRRYSPDNTIEEFTVAKDGIRIIPETREDDKIFESIWQSAGWAERICFLGFGFDRLNMHRLGLDSLFEWKNENMKPLPKVIASTYGMTPAEVARIQSTYFSQVEFVPFPQKNLMTLRESGVLS